MFLTPLHLMPIFEGFITKRNNISSKKEQKLMYRTYSNMLFRSRRYMNVNYFYHHHQAYLFY